MPLYSLTDVCAALPEKQLLNVQANDLQKKYSFSSVTQDSRRVTSGDLFVCISGVMQKGTEYVPMALEKGCRALMVSREDVTESLLSLCQGIPCIIVENTRLCFAHLACFFSGPPPAHIVAVTGTNGKTSVAHFIQKLLTFSGQRAAAIGTLGLTLDPLIASDIGSGIDLPYLTTPDSLSLHRTCRALAIHDVPYLAVEASSHGLDQYRLHALPVEVAIFTNLTRDHLDYHGDEKHYFEAKARLFKELLLPNGTGIIVQKDQWSQALCQMIRAQGQNVIEIAGLEADENTEKQASYALKSVKAHETGQTITFRHHNQIRHINVPLVGDFQSENIMCALATLESFGHLTEAVWSQISTLPGVPGRMEFAGSFANKASVYVDFAHTPDAVSTALQALRPHIHGKVHVIIGAGGDRDPGKRFYMGKAAAENADYVIVTDDNPRTEDPAIIRKQVAQGCPGAKVIAGRAEAIAIACQQLAPQDALLIAGKGHENGQIIGDIVHPFNDIDVARNILSQRRSVS